MAESSLNEQLIFQLEKNSLMLQKLEEQIQAPKFLSQDLFEEIRLQIDPQYFTTATSSFVATKPFSVNTYDHCSIAAEANVGIGTVFNLNLFYGSDFSSAIYLTNVGLAPANFSSIYRSAFAYGGILPYNAINETFKSGGSFIAVLYSPTGSPFTPTNYNSVARVILFGKRKKNYA